MSNWLLFPPLSHEGHSGPHPPVGLTPGSFIFAAIVGIAAIAVYLVVTELRARRALAVIKKARHESALRERLQRRRLYSAGLVLLILASGFTGAALSGTGGEGDLSKSPSPSTQPPAPGSDFPLEFTTIDASGGFTAVVRNTLSEKALLQCSVLAFDDRDRPVLTRTYTAQDEQGKEVQSDAYTVFLELRPKSEQVFEATLPVSAPVARMEGACREVVRSKGEHSKSVWT